MENIEEIFEISTEEQEKSNLDQFVNDNKLYIFFNAIRDLFVFTIIFIFSRLTYSLIYAIFINASKDNRLFISAIILVGLTFSFAFFKNKKISISIGYSIIVIIIMLFLLELKFTNSFYFFFLLIFVVSILFYYLKDQKIKDKLLNVNSFNKIGILSNNCNFSKLRKQEELKINVISRNRFNPKLKKQIIDKENYLNLYYSNNIDLKFILRVSENGNIEILHQKSNDNIEMFNRKIYEYLNSIC